jgi:hypothetical protein
MSQQMTAPSEKAQVSAPAESPNDPCARCGFPRREHALGYSRSSCTFGVIPEWSAPRPMEGSETSDDAFEDRMRTITERCDDATDISPRHARERNRALNHLFADDIPWLIALARSSRENEREARKDSERIDALDKTREPVTNHDGTELIAYAWGVHGQHLGVREALDDLVAEFAESASVSLGASEEKGR